MSFISFLNTFQTHKSPFPFLAHQFHYSCIILPKPNLSYLILVIGSCVKCFSVYLKLTLNLIWTRIVNTLWFKTTVVVTSSVYRWISSVTKLKCSHCWMSAVCIVTNSYTLNTDKYSTLSLLVKRNKLLQLYKIFWKAKEWVSEKLEYMKLIEIDENEGYYGQSRRAITTRHGECLKLIIWIFDNT